MNHLAAINRLLTSAQLSTITTESSPDVNTAKAITILDEVVLRELERGWSFNTDYDLPVSIVGGFGTPPAGTLTIRVRPENSGGKDIVLRDGKLYDRTNRTATFTETEILCDIAVTPSPSPSVFENCPLVFQEYAIACASVKFAVQVSVDPQTAAQLRADEARAWQALLLRDDQQLSTSIYKRWPASTVSRRWPALNQ